MKCSRVSREVQALSEEAVSTPAPDGSPQPPCGSGSACDVSGGGGGGGLVAKSCPTLAPVNPKRNQS